MKITVYGARGSIPVCGASTLRYGGDTTCLAVETRSGETIILDAGTGIRSLGDDLDRRGCRDVHVLFTHCHWDHVQGLPFLKHLYLDGRRVSHYGFAAAPVSARDTVAGVLRPPFFPVAPDGVSAELRFAENCPEGYEIAGVAIRTIPMNHPNGGVGYLLSEGDRTVAFLPDNELRVRHPGGPAYEEVAGLLEGVDLLIHDAEFLPEEYEAYAEGWGHSVYLDVVGLAAHAWIGHLILWHLNKDRDDEEADRLLADARDFARASQASLQCDLAFTGMTVDVDAL